MTQPEERSAGEFNTVINAFDTVQFVFETGSDDLRGNSQLFASLIVDNDFPIVDKAVLHEKDEDDGWKEGSSVSKQISLGAFGLAPIDESRLDAVRLVVHSNNAAFQNDDQWEVSRIRIWLADGPIWSLWFDRNVLEDPTHYTVFSRDAGYGQELLKPYVVRSLF